MAKTVILGSAAAVNDATHDYTHFLLIGDQGSPILVDAGSNPLGKLKNLGLDYTSIFCRLRLGLVELVGWI